MSSPSHRRAPSGPNQSQRRVHRDDQIHSPRPGLGLYAARSAKALLVGGLFAGGLFAGGFAPEAQGSFYTWDGGGSSNDLTEPGNYAPDGAPPNDRTANIDFADSPRPFPTVTSYFRVEGLILSANASTYNLLGATLDIGLGGVTNASNRTHVIDNDVVLATSQYWVALAPLIHNGDVDGATGSLFLAGDSNFSFNGSLLGDLTMDGEGTVTLSGNSDLSSLHVRTGKLEIDTDQLGASLPTIQMEAGTALSAAGTHATNSRLFITGGQTLYEGNGILTVGEIDGAIPTQYSLRIDTAGELRVEGGSATTGVVEIDRGVFESGSTAACFDVATIGDGVGSPASATLRTRTFLDSPIQSVTILEDGCLEVLGSKERIDALQMTGGCVQGAGAQLYTTTLEILPSASGSLVQPHWRPFDGGITESTVQVGNGSAAVDLEIAGDLLGAQSGTLHKAGGGQLRFSGGSLGSVALLLEEGSVFLDTQNPNLGANHVEMSAGTVLTLGGPGQLNDFCSLVVLEPATINMVSDERIRTLDVNGLTVLGTGELEIHQAFGMTCQVGSTNVFSVPLFLSSETSPNILCDPFAHVGLLIGASADHDMRVQGGGQVAALNLSAPTVKINDVHLRVFHVDGNLRQESGTVSPDASQAENTSLPAELTIDGDFEQIAGEVEIQIYGDPASLEFDRMAIAGTATLGGALVVEEIGSVEFLPGDRFPILVAETLVGEFASVSLPTLADGLTMEVETDLGANTIVLNIVGESSGTPEHGPVSAPHRPTALRMFPNPVPARTDAFHIHYSVERAGPTRAELYEVSGRRVATLFHGVRNPGTYEFEGSFGARGLAAGSYMLVVQSKGKVERGAITILR